MKVRPGIVFVLLAALLTAACENSERHLVGTLERDRITLVAERSEPVTELYVKEGAEVEAGERILQLDASRAIAERERLAALTKQAQRRVDELTRGPREESIREARARLAAAEGLRQNAQHEFERVRRLHAENLASASALDAARAARDARQGEYDAAKAALQAMLEGTTIEELDQARAQHDAALAALRTQQMVIDRLTVRASRSGRVEALPYKPGAQPPQGAEVAILLAGAPYARVHVPAAWLEQFRESSNVTVRVAGFGEYAGHVRWVSATAAFTPYFALTEYDRDRLSYAAEIELSDESRDALPAGVPVEVIAVTGSNDR